MRKNVFGRQFSRDTNQRKSLFKSLISSLILDESIKTTLEKAKAIKGEVDKIVNKGKLGNERLKIQFLQKSLDKDAMNKVIKDIAPRLKDRSSGYTRIIKMGRRFSDNASMVVMEWVIKPEAKSEKLPSSVGRQVRNDVKGLPAGKVPAGKVKEKPKVKRKAAKK
jgi:large subunit ribosomal protein L17